MEEIIIEKINYKAFISVLITMFLLVAAIFVMTYGFDVRKMRFWLIGIIAVIGLLIGFIIALINALQVKRLLTITWEGIIDNSSLGGMGFISFDEIKEFTIVRIYDRKAIAIIPKNMEKFLPKLSVVKRKMAKRNMKQNLPAFTISTHIAKDMAAEDILSLLKKRLKDYSSLYE